MADGIEHLNAVMDLLPQVTLSIIEEDRSVAFWVGGAAFDVREAFAIGFDMHLCLSTDAKDLSRFSVRTPHVMGAVAGDTINIDDGIAVQIAQQIHAMIEAGALLHDA